MKGPRTPELRGYLLDLIREERALERLYRASHTTEQLAQVRMEWKHSYRSIRQMLALQDSLMRYASPKPERSPACGVIRSAGWQSLS